MRIAITGSTGLIGSYLVKYFTSKGHEVIEVSRKIARDSNPKSFVIWDPTSGKIDAVRLEGMDVVIHLAGATISSPWTPAHKKVLRSSRIDSTRLLTKTLGALKHRPKLFISASAIGYYGNKSPSEMVNESSPAANDFLATLCQDWEKEAQPAQNAGIRVVFLRTGIVLARQGGALGKMLPIFQLGMGGVLGDGRQMMSWIALAEMPYIIEHIIRTTQLSGPVNCVAPNPVSNQEFTKVLGLILHRPVIFPVPAFGIQMLFGEMGRTLLLEGVGVAPKKLLESGYKFRYDDLKLALTAALKT